jgi:hypothetical protein
MISDFINVILIEDIVTFLYMCILHVVNIQERETYVRQMLLYHVAREMVRICNCCLLFVIQLISIFKTHKIRQHLKISMIKRLCF